MFQFVIGMAMGWLAFTEEGRKTANEIGRKTMDEVKRTLKDVGLFDDVPKATDSTNQDP